MGEGSKRWRLNKEDALDIGRYLASVMLATVIVVVCNVLGMIDFGNYEAWAALVLTPVLPAIKKWATDYAKLE